MSGPWIYAVTAVLLGLTIFAFLRRKKHKRDAVSESANNRLLELQETSGKELINALEREFVKQNLHGAEIKIDYSDPEYFHIKVWRGGKIHVAGHLHVRDFGHEIYGREFTNEGRWGRTIDLPNDKNGRAAFVAFVWKLLKEHGGPADPPFAQKYQAVQ
jgi:hypothetical protein